jgi:hypothetical protein
MQAGLGKTATKWEATGASFLAACNFDSLSCSLLLLLLSKELQENAS